MYENSIRRAIFPLLILVVGAGCSTFAPSAYLNSSALGAIETDKGFCIEEKSLDPRRINASNTIEQMFANAGFTTSCGADAYTVEWSFEATDQRVDHTHLPTFCSGYGYWRSCSGGQGNTLTTYQRSFRLVVREAVEALAPDESTDALADERLGAVWVASVDSRGTKTDYVALMSDLMQPVLNSLGKNHENTVIRLVRPAE